MEATSIRIHATNATLSGRISVSGLGPIDGRGSGLGTGWGGSYGGSGGDPKCSGEYFSNYPYQVFLPLLLPPAPPTPMLR